MAREWRGLQAFFFCLGGAGVACAWRGLGPSQSFFALPAQEPGSLAGEASRRRTLRGLPEPWSLDGAAGPPRIPGIPRSAAAAARLQGSRDDRESGFAGGWPCCLGVWRVGRGPLGVTALGTIGIRPFQRAAGPHPARHMTSDGEAGFPVIQGGGGAAAHTPRGFWGVLGDQRLRPGSRLPAPCCGELGLGFEFRLAPQEKTSHIMRAEDLPHHESGRPPTSRERETSHIMRAEDLPHHESGRPPISRERETSHIMRAGDLPHRHWGHRTLARAWRGYVL
eukprot:gene8698-biopygen10673